MQKRPSVRFCIREALADGPQIGSVINLYVASYGYSLRTAYATLLNMHQEGEVRRVQRGSRYRPSVYELVG